MTLSASSPTKPENDSSQGAKLFKEIQAAAHQMRSPAGNLLKLSSEPGAKWADYDREWNTMKPAQEQIGLAAQRLEQLKSSLTAEEQQQFSKMQKEIAVINAATHDIWTRIGQEKVDLKAAALKTDSRRLDKAVRDLLTDSPAKS